MTQARLWYSAGLLCLSINLGNSELGLLRELRAKRFDPAGQLFWDAPSS